MIDLHVDMERGCRDMSERMCRSEDLEGPLHLQILSSGLLLDSSRIGAVK